LIQLVPKEHAERHTRRGLGYREIGDAQLAHFHLDKALEQNLARTLAALARPLLPSETGDYRDQQGANKARQAPSLTVATAPIGWHGGAVQFSNRLLRPYYAWRDLETLAFKIKLRDSILDSLNSVLKQVGRRLEFAQSELRFGERGSEPRWIATTMNSTAEPSTRRAKVTSTGDSPRMPSLIHRKPEPQISASRPTRMVVARFTVWPWPARPARRRAGRSCRPVSPTGPAHRAHRPGDVSRISRSSRHPSPAGPRAAGGQGG